jgi:hypothetical membrane protein
MYSYKSNILLHTFVTLLFIMLMFQALIVTNIYITIANLRTTTTLFYIIIIFFWKLYYNTIALRQK